MRAIRRTILALIVMMCPLSARAQTGISGGGRSLGGYGAASIGRYYSSSQGSYLPYNGTASGFVPYRSGFASGLGLQAIPRRLPQTSIGGSLMPMTPIGGASLSTTSGRRAFLPFGYEGGIGRRGGLIGTPLTGSSASRRTPLGPGLGNPFQSPWQDGRSGVSIMAMP